MMHRRLSARRGVPRGGIPRPSVLVRRVRRGLGSQHNRSVPLRSSVSEGAGVTHPRKGTSGCPEGPEGLVVLLQGRVVAVFCDNMTAIAYLRREGGTFSPRPNAIA